MNNYELLNNTLSMHNLIGKDSPVYASVEVDSPNLMKLRDNLLMLGDILEEDIDREIYVSSVKTGRTDFAKAYVASMISNNRIYFACSSVEGVINQNNAKKALNRIKSIYPELEIKNEKNKKIKAKKGKKKFPRWMVFLILFVGIAVGSGVYLKQFSSVTMQYNEIVSTYNEAANEYNRLLPQTSVENITGFYENLPNISDTDTNLQFLVKSILNGNTIRKVENDINTLKSLTQNINKDVEIIKQITAPEASWVLSRIKSLQDLTDAAMVTEDNDPNQMLGKEGGYTGCVYFSLASISDVAGSDAIEKGTDGGGAIEIYPTLVDAQNRCDYLSQYDGTLLYSGSYAIVGTMVIRVSYELDANEQFKITSSLTYLLAQ